MKSRALSLFAVTALSLFLLKPTVLAHEVDVGNASQGVVHEAFAESSSALSQLSRDFARPDGNPERVPASDFSLYLPVVNNNPGCIITTPSLISPANGSHLDTLIPMFKWDAGNDPNAIGLRVDFASTPDFNRIWLIMRSWWQATGQGEWRWSENFDPGTTLYWRTCLFNDEFEGPYSEVWSFTTGSGGTILPGPSLVSPANGGIVPSLPVTLQWSALGGALEYLVEWRVVGSPETAYRWVTGDETEVSWLDANATYEWWVRARSDYAHGNDSEIWQFTTSAGSSSSPGSNPDSTISIKKGDSTYIITEYARAGSRNSTIANWSQR